MLKLGWFSSGRGPGSRNLLSAVMDGIRGGDLDASVSFVFCNWDNTESDNPKKDERNLFFEQVASYGIPLVTLSWKTFKPDLWKRDETEWRNEYGKEMRRLLSKYDFDLGILAGYMLWMDDETCDTFDLLNLHPALPDGPKGTWQEVIWKLIEENAGTQGSMMHICTKDWDRGDAISFCEFPIRGGAYDALWDSMRSKTENSTVKDIADAEGTEEPLFGMIRREGAKRELPLILSTIKQFADGNISISDKKLYYHGKRLDGPFDVSGDVEEYVNGRI